ncbi:hypothetical protein ES332_A11G153900v1 [Gossypium tomentosum]|uniref:Uncharacterized protein n=1 Tax=Gossypium tomentosum TaxID=34277 RepID=A0A5D2NE69_GOSTO|nr:hypothetical protein ES332_A11G153900v1 [Gossypium tomentosum]
MQRSSLFTRFKGHLKAEASGLEGQKKRNPHGLPSVPISPTKAVPATDLACGPRAWPVLVVGVSDGMGVVEAGAEQRRARGWAEAGPARPRHAAPRVFCCKHFVFFIWARVSVIGLGFG